MCFFFITTEFFYYGPPRSAKPASISFVTFANMFRLWFTQSSPSATCQLCIKTQMGELSSFEYDTVVSTSKSIFFKSNKKFFRHKHFSPQFIQHRLWDYEQSIALCMAAGSTTLRAIRRALSSLLGSQNDELHEWESKDTDWTCRRIPVPPPPPLPPVSCPTKLMTCLKLNTWEL